MTGTSWNKMKEEDGMVAGKEMDAGTTAVKQDSGNGSPGGGGNVWETKGMDAMGTKREPKREQKREIAGDPSTGKVVDSRFTELERKNLVLLGIVVVMGLITIGTWAAIASWDGSDRVEENARINVNHVYVKESLENTDEQTYTLTLNIFLTNGENEKARDVHLEVAGIDHDSKLTYAIGETEVGDIEGRNTINVSVEITIPIVKSYKMQLMVFQDDTIKVKGYRIDTINISQTNGPRKDFTVTYSQQSTRRVVEKGDEEVSEWTVLAGYLFYVVLVIQLYFVLRLMDFAALRSAIRKLVRR